MISKDKQYRTRDGREVRIYATDGYGDNKVHGAVKEDSGWVIYAWYEDGRYALSDYKGRHDLIEVKPRIKRTVWLNFYEDNTMSVFGSIERAKQQAAVGYCLACVKVEIDCEEGEGL